MANLKISDLIQRAPDGTEFLEVIIPPFTPGTNRRVLLSDLLPSANAAGTDNYTASLASAFTSYISGRNVQIVFANPNTGAVTIDLNGLGPKAITKNGSTPLAAGDITAGQALFLYYDGTQFQIQGGGGGGTSIPFGTTAGTNTYTSSTTPATAAYVNGMLVHIKIKDASTGASTLDLDSIGGKKIMISPTVQAGNGDLTDEQNYLLSYDSALDAAAGAFIVVGKLIPDATSTTKGIGKLYPNLSAQNTDGAPDQNSVVDALALKQDLVNTAVAITDASTMDLTAIKHTLTTSSATRTFTISYTGDDITLEVILSAVSSVFTFPATSLCISEGISTGDNTCPLAGVSGDTYLIAIKKVGSNYRLVCKNFKQ